MSHKPCECLEGCLFYNEQLKNFPEMTSLFKKNYCLGGDNANCALYIVRNVLGNDMIPANLFPHQIDKAKALITQG